MANNVVLIFSMTVILFTTSKIQGQGKEDEKITLFLKQHEVTKIIDVDRRFERLKISGILGAEKSFQITAFGNTFIVDLSIFYPRRDAEIDFISKASNASDTFPSPSDLLHQGYVRNVNKSFVIGYFNERKLFRGYVITNEVFCIEPYQSDKVIVYRFKDVIYPGCSKVSENEDLDCSNTRYFKPWYVSKAPSARRLFPNSNLLYDNYLEFYHRLQMKKAEEKKRKEQKDHSSTGKHHDNKGKDKRISLKKSDCPKNESCEHYKPGGKSELKRNHHKKSDCPKNESCEYHKPGGKTEHKNEDRKKSGVTSFNLINDVSNETENEDEYEDQDDESDEEKDDEDDDYPAKLLKDDDRFPDSVSDFLRNKNLTITNKILSKTFDGKHIRRRSLVESLEKYQEQTVKRKEKQSNHEPIVEALKNDPIEALECNVEVAVAPSFIKKMNNIEMATKDIFIQIMLLNKIFLKTPLRVKGKNIRFTLRVSQIVMYDDEFYSPFTKRVDLDYFKRTNQPLLDYCLQIGLVNQHLNSREFFDGYTPEGKGGICSYSGNVIIVSHGNENAPAPMAVYFASFIRAVTRAMGASDKDGQCAEGSYPNPMQVLKDYLLADEILPTQKYSIFTKCNIKEIEKLFQTRGCLVSVSKPLCGNAILDPGEECDCGPASMCHYIDECCNFPVVDPKEKKRKIEAGNKSCTLVEGAKCASLEECCSACEIETLKNVCFSGPGDCDRATCDGKSASCPVGVEASNGMMCSYNISTEPFICKDSKCDQPLCSSFKLEPCTCALGTERECVYCCVKDGKCQSAAKELKLIPDRDFNLLDGTECMGGICVKGKCMTPSGNRVHYNRTFRRPPPNIAANSDVRNECSVLHTIIGSAFSLLTLSLLQLST